MGQKADILRQGVGLGFVPFCRLRDLPLACRGHLRSWPLPPSSGPVTWRLSGFFGCHSSLSLSSAGKGSSVLRVQILGPPRIVSHLNVLSSIPLAKSLLPCEVTCYGLQRQSMDTSERPPLNLTTEPDHLATVLTFTFLPLQLRERLNASKLALRPNKSKAQELGNLPKLYKTCHRLVRVPFSLKVGGRQ